MSENHSVPDFNLANGRGYLLDRNFAAASRLNYQFYLWKDSLGFNLHPSIALPTKDYVAIADVATGTAIWLIDVARERPTAELDGFDIDLAQAPKPPWLPSNVRLRKWDIFDEVPSDVVGKYDVVHVRLLILVVRNGDPREVLTKLAKMLKPGGYLQWDDLNYPDTYVRTINKNLETPALDELRELVYSRGRNDWTLELAEIASEQGFEDAKLYHFEDRIELAKANGEQHLLTMEEFAIRLVSVDKKTEAMELQQLLGRAQEDSLDGAALSMPRVVCVAKKRQLNVSKLE